MQILDIAPIRYPVTEEVTDTVDSVGVFGQQFSESTQAGGGGSSSSLLWSILVVLISLGICLLMVRMYRKRLIAAR